MNEIDMMLIERACARLVNHYANLLDAYDHDAFMELWTDDAVLDMLGRQYRGREAIRGWLEAREPDMICRHLVTNNVTDVLSGISARGFCYSIAYRVRGMRGHEPGLIEPPTFIVQYRNEFRLHPERGWVFSRRDVEAVMVGPEQMQALKGAGLVAAARAKAG